MANILEGPDTVIPQVCDETVDTPKHDMWYFNLRYHYHPWEIKHIEYDDIVMAVRETFPEDPGLIVTPLRNSMNGIYRVALNEPVPENEYIIKLKKNGNDVDAKLYLHKRGQRTPGGNTYRTNTGNESRPGMIVIFNDAYIQDAKKIPGDAFDKAISKYGKVIRPTLYHTIGETRQLDGHRYCIIEAKNKDEIPHTINIYDGTKSFTFSLWWPNKPKFCYRCGQLHANKCPEMEAFYRAIEERNKQVVKRTIYTDSTLRLSEKVGLLADVIAMSGGTIGEIGNVVRDDKESNGLTVEKSEIIVLAGKNNVRQVDGSNDMAKAAYAIDKGIEKIVNGLDERQEVNFVNVIQEPEDITPHQNIISDYMEMTLNNISSTNPKVKVTHIPGENIEKDHSGHPTENVTLTILKALTQVYPDLIINEKYCTNKQYYRGVDSVYKYGCYVCDKNGNYSKFKGFCDACEDDFQKSELTETLEKLKQLYVQYFPPVNLTENQEKSAQNQDELMESTAKRSHPDSDSDKEEHKRVHTTDSIELTSEEEIFADTMENVTQLNDHNEGQMDHQ